MATLTPLAKGLIGLAVIGGMASAIWHLGLKTYLADRETLTSPAASASPTPALSAPVAVSPAPTSAPEPKSEPKPAPTTSAPTKGAALSAAESAEKGRQMLDAGNYAQARAFLEHAVKQGDGSAACHLGEMTLKGQGGLTADRDKAASLFQLAQSRGLICFATGQ